jgi:hypothetical protein
MQVASGFGMTREQAMGATLSGRDTGSRSPLTAPPRSAPSGNTERQASRMRSNDTGTWNDLLVPSDSGSGSGDFVERMTGFEPATLTLAR